MNKSSIAILFIFFVLIISSTAYAATDMERLSDCAKNESLSSISAKKTFGAGENPVEYYTKFFNALECAKEGHPDLNNPSLRVSWLSYSVADSAGDAAGIPREKKYGYVFQLEADNDKACYDSHASCIVPCNDMLKSGKSTDSENCAKDCNSELNSCLKQASTKSENEVKALVMAWAKTLPYEKESLMQNETELNFAKIVSFKGQVQIRKDGNDKWFDITEGSVLHEGEFIACGPSSNVVLEISDGTTVKLKEFGHLKIDSLFKGEKTTKILLLLNTGSMSAKVDRVGGVRTDFRVRTPVSMWGVRGTEFHVKYDEKARIASVYVEKGEVSFTDENGNGEIILNAGQYSQIDESGSIQSPKSGNEITDKWWEEKNSNWCSGSLGLILFVAVSILLVNLRK